MSEEQPTETSPNFDDLHALDYICNELFTLYKTNHELVKVGDLLKAIEIRRKLSVSGTGEKIFWEMINKLREEELAGPPDPSARRKRPGRGKQKTAARDKSAKEEISQ